MSDFTTATTPITENQLDEMAKLIAYIQGCAIECGQSATVVIGTGYMAVTGKISGASETVKTRFSRLVFKATGFLVRFISQQEEADNEVLSIVPAKGAVLAMIREIRPGYVGSFALMVIGGNDTRFIDGLITEADTVEYLHSENIGGDSFGTSNRNQEGYTKITARLQDYESRGVLVVGVSSLGYCFAAKETRFAKLNTLTDGCELLSTDSSANTTNAVATAVMLSGVAGEDVYVANRSVFSSKTIPLDASVGITVITHPFTGEEIAVSAGAIGIDCGTSSAKCGKASKLTYSSVDIIQEMMSPDAELAAEA